MYLVLLLEMFTLNHSVTFIYFVSSFPRPFLLAILSRQCRRQRVTVSHYNWGLFDAFLRSNGGLLCILERVSAEGQETSESRGYYWHTNYDVWRHTRYLTFLGNVYWIWPSPVFVMSWAGPVGYSTQRSDHKIMSNNIFFLNEWNDNITE